jgi:uncharacterized protein (TIGR02391 family)
MSGHELVMIFDPNTIEHLGVKMYSQIPTAIAELIANAYDADAHHVIITLNDGTDKSVIVEDDGIGMSFDEVNDYFLRIGRNRRAEGQIRTLSGRIATGKKGLGKLALFGIGDTIEVSTIKDGQEVTFRMNWSDLKNTHGQNYKPNIISETTSSKASGTKITLSDLKRKSPFDIEALAISLSRLFNFYDSTFSVAIKRKGIQKEVNNELKYSEIEQEFDFIFPAYFQDKGLTYQYRDDIVGKVITSEKPLQPGLRGITLFANGRLVNAPEFFGRSESSHFYSYVTGWLNIDFVDNWDDDVISTNRQSLNWDLDSTRLLRDFLQDVLSQIQKDWRDLRKNKRRSEISVKSKINISEWYDKLPNEIQSTVEKIVNSLDDSELSSAKQAEAVQNMHLLVPEYPYYHWRNLHEEIQLICYEYYKNEDYYTAFSEAIKRYSNATRGKSGITHSVAQEDYDLMAKAFHHRSGNLCVTSNYLRPNGAEFSPATLENIQVGQFQFSQGTIAGGRNPVAHEEVNDLRESDLFSEKDCLDLLSLLSHLFKRLDNAVKK